MSNQTKQGCGAAAYLPPAILVIVALLLPYFFNVHIFREEQGFALSFLSYLSSAALTLAVLVLCCRIRTLGFIFLPILFVFVFLSWFVYHSYGIHVTPGVVSSIIETDKREAAPFITFGNVMMVVVPLLAMAALILAGHKLLTKKVSNITLIASLVVFGIFAGISTPIANSWKKEHTPASHKPSQLVRNLSGGMFWPLYDLNSLMMVVHHFSKGASLCYDILQLPDGYVPAKEGEQGEDDIIITLMLGESVRADHMQFNGYGRETTPCLAKRGEQLVGFPRTCSFGLFTRISVMGVLTDAEVENRTAYHKPFISTLNKEGFDTSCITLQDEGLEDAQMTMLLQDCSKKYHVDTRVVTEGHAREETVASFTQAVQEAAGKPKVFHYVYDTGAHSPYDRVEANKAFLPDDAPPPRFRELRGQAAQRLRQLLA